MLKGAHQAVPLFWFDVLDGRGPTGVRDAIAEHIDPDKIIIATAGDFAKPTPAKPSPVKPANP
jgi:hypothetical protein